MLAEALGVALSWPAKDNAEPLVAPVPRDPEPMCRRSLGLLVRFELARKQRRSLWGKLAKVSSGRRWRLAQGARLVRDKDHQRSLDTECARVAQLCLHKTKE